MIVERVAIRAHSVDTRSHKQRRRFRGVCLLSYRERHLDEDEEPKGLGEWRTRTIGVNWRGPWRRYRYQAIRDIRRRG